jgi:hypothetical protein
MGRRALTVSALVAAAAIALFLWLVLPFAGRSLRPPLPEVIVVTGVVAAALTIVLGVATGRRWTRWLFLLLSPVLLAELVVGYVAIPWAVADARLVDGRTAHLVIAPVLTDTVYDLWVDSGLFSRRVDTELEYSEDGRFVGDEKLALSRDGRRLLVGRGGIWTDCLAIASNFAPCNLGLERHFWDDPDFEPKMRANSAEFAKLL